MDNLNYEEIGLKAGFEIHQELDTHKLFCNCPSKLQEKKPPMLVRRELRPTESELGEVDRAALAEAEKSKHFRYEIHPQSVCLVEMDEEPPHPVNEEARDIAIECSLLLNATPVDEAHVMRKTVIDGSNTAGFQRTILIATDGELDMNGKKISLPTICLEEDAARKTEEKKDYTQYRLDRLGIPLLEIATGPDFNNPEKVTEAAEKIGRILRATGKMKRGIGTIRQDVNVSIKEGTRQEIKGVQELSLIKTVVEKEAQRQLKLLEIKSELKERKAPKAEKKMINVTDIFSQTESNILKSEISDGEVFAIKVEGFNGLLGKELTDDHHFGTELSDYAKVYSGVDGLFHTDELPAYGVTEKEVDQLQKNMNASKEDSIVIIADKKEKAEKGFEAVIDRINMAFEGVPKETRRALPNGNTQYMRPLPGAARMYVETDVPSTKISKEKIEKIKKNLPEKPDTKKKRYIKEFGLNKELAKLLSISEKSNLFEETANEYSIDPKIIASTLTQDFTKLENEGIPVDSLNENQIKMAFKMVSVGKISKDALPSLFERIAKGTTVEKAIEDLDLKKMDKKDISRIISNIVKEKSNLIDERGEKSIDALMGLAMKEIGGKADGKIVHEILEEKINENL